MTASLSPVGSHAILLTYPPILYTSIIREIKENENFQLKMRDFVNATYRILFTSKRYNSTSINTHELELKSPRNFVLEFYGCGLAYETKSWTRETLLDQTLIKPTLITTLNIICTLLLKLLFGKILKKLRVFVKIYKDVSEGLRFIFVLVFCVASQLQKTIIEFHSPRVGKAEYVQVCCYGLSGIASFIIISIILH